MCTRRRWQRLSVLAIPSSSWACGNYYVKFYFASGGEQGVQLEEGPRRKEDQKPANVKVPILPSEEEQERHAVDHSPYASWCRWCVMGRCPGMPHTSKPEKDEGICMAEYTFWSHVGYNYTKEATAGACCSLTMRHMQSGAIVASVASRKGAWPYVVALVGDVDWAAQGIGGTTLEIPSLRSCGFWMQWQAM